MRFAALVAALALALALGVTPAAATSARAAKPLSSCAALTPDDLKLVFAQPWRNGADQLGGACTFERPTGSKVPNIVVAVIVDRRSSPKKAKQAFARAKVATEDIVEQIEPIRRLGDEGYLTIILGADVLSFRAGRDLVEIRAHRIDKLGETYHDQVLALGDIIEAKLLRPPEKKKSPSG